MFHKTAVSPELLEIARSLSGLPELNSFRMVGGTAIALQIGHRKSIDIDFFSNERIDKAVLANVFRKNFPDVEIQISSYHIQTVIKGVRVELYDDWQNPFRYEPLLEEGIRLAALNDLAALKLNAITERREKKDYIDLYFLSNLLGQKNILEEFKEYNPLLSPKSILFALEEVITAEKNKSVMPEMLTAFSWKEVKKVCRMLLRLISRCSLKPNKLCRGRLRVCGLQPLAASLTILDPLENFTILTARN